MIRLRSERGPTSPVDVSLSKAPSPQVLVRLHVEPHGEEEELHPGDDQGRDEHDRRDRDRVARDAKGRFDDAEDDPRDEEDKPQPPEEDERVEVADDVLLLQPPEEALEQEPGDRRHDPPEADAAPLTAPVGWPT